MIHGIILTSLFLIGGFWLAGSIFRQRRLLTWGATGTALAWSIFLIASLLVRSNGLSTQPKLVVFYGVSIALLALAWYMRSHFILPTRAALGGGMRDAVILAVLAPVLLAVIAISAANGQQDNGQWIFHGFYNGDTTTFVSLVQKSFFTPSLVTDNPFAAGLPLEYPTLLHGAMADFFSFFQVTVDWIHFLPIMILLGVLVTIPLFFLLFDETMPEPANAAEAWFGVSSRGWIYVWQGMIVLYVLAYAWDNYVYPQSHFFLTSLSLLLVALLVSLSKAAGSKFWVTLGLAMVTAVGLLFANAVMGAIAIALLVLYGLYQATNKRVLPLNRTWYLLLAALMVITFFLFSSGNAQFGRPDFSYTAATDMIRFAPIVTLLLAALFVRSGDDFIRLATVGIALLGFFTFFFSTRSIIIDNASRFFYHALLLGFPFLLPLLIRIGFWLRRELFFTTREGLSRFIPWIATAIGLLFLALPPLASVASTFDHLLRNDEHIVSNIGREAVWWINDHTSPEDVILASPEAPWIVPFFTGRSLLRAGSASDGAYWLSANDDAFDLELRAFVGDKAAQVTILPQADWLVLAGAERLLWEPLPYEKVLDIKELVIYKLR